MSVTMAQFVELVEEIAPRGLACVWDNTGLLLRCGDSVGSVLICLDVTRRIADEAAECGCDMILAHHPLVFAPVKSLDFEHPSQGVLMRLVRSGISLYAAHTSFDLAPGGVNDALAELIDLANVRIADEEGLMRAGCLPRPLTGVELISRVKRALGVPHVRVTAGFKGEISRVAVISGSGGEYAAGAKAAGAQALITGEAKHQHRIEAAETGVMLIEAGHFHTERCFVDAIFSRLQARANALQLHLGLKKAQCMQAPDEIC